MFDIATVVPQANLNAEPWDSPPRRAPAASAPVLAVDGFEGPLDWLLEMVRAHKLDLRRLSILALVEAFASAMDAAMIPNVSTPELARWTAWTVMAAQLTELRSRLLLPADAPEAQKAQAEAEALRRQWITRAEMAAAADWLDRRPQLGRDVFARGRPEPVSAGEGAGPARATAASSALADDDVDGLASQENDDLTELLRACLVALRLPSDGEIYQPRRLVFWSVGDATKQIERMLPTLAGGAALEVFLPAATSSTPITHHRAALAATLIASLELARGGSLTLEQDTLWQPIHVDHAIASA